MDVFIITIVSIVWAVLMICTFIITMFSDKLKINKIYVVYSWEILKYVTIAFLGYLLGAGTNGK